MNIRILTVTDIHQSRLLFRQLQAAVTLHRPAILAFVGDFLNAWDCGSNREQLSTEEMATQIARLPVDHILFTRGNHEDQNWYNFIYAWPHETRSLVALHGTTFSIGPLVILGFPCTTGNEEPWCDSMPKTGNVVTPDPSKSGLKAFAADYSTWVPRVMRQLGRSGRHLWLAHEPPLNHPLAYGHAWNPEWKKAVERFSPFVVVSGHAHDTPLENKRWHAKLGDTLCVNVGQKAGELQYCVLDYVFVEGTDVPRKIKVAAYPWADDITIQ